MNEKRLSPRHAFWALTGFVVGVLVTVAVTAIAAPGLMIEERRSPYDVATTVQTIVTNATARGWVVPKIYDFREALARPAGPDLAPIRVVELCQRDYARELLKSGRNRFVATMMPCAIAVYEKEDGRTYVASMNVGLMGRLFGGEIRAIMGKVAEDDKEILNFLAWR